MSPQEPVALDRIESYAFGLDHAEGICVTPAGDVYVGGEAGQIYRIVDDRPVELASTGGFLLGLAADAQGRIYAIDNVAKCVWRFDPASKGLTVYAKGPAGKPFNVPNWGAFDRSGNYYLTDSGDWMAGNGFIWLVRPGGRAEVWSEASTAFPNGCCLAADGQTLYIAESVPAALVAIDIRPDGSAGERRVLCDLGMTVPDGVAVTTEGSIVIACYRPDVIYRWHPKTGLSVLAADPRGTVLAAPTNIVFTGPGLDTLVVPNLGRWHLARGRFGLAGVPLHYPTADQLGS
ncbi:MAG: SMP-30/gluconolactonase/LRE family protein [Devosia nanyangense]|uniref:SMP-30/gluconolactonase/LRE family protein n=1 Tax=Devosia nanyangense TaxID=1228055 RepID=A0A933L1D6_9HYPH|nr:SMP-30/gluconolactonase/LRE family protein [Devosia nanyangense]